jgi:hypothetical protein
MTGGALYYMRARYLDTGMGRFVTRDPQGLLGSSFLAMYSYANNNPLAELDPTGKDALGDVYGIAYDVGYDLGFIQGFVANGYESVASTIGDFLAGFSFAQALYDASDVNTGVAALSLAGLLAEASAAGESQGEQSGNDAVNALDAYLGESALNGAALGAGGIPTSAPNNSDPSAPGYGPGNFSRTIRTRSERHPNTGPGGSGGGNPTPGPSLGFGISIPGQPGGGAP